VPNRRLHTLLPLLRDIDMEKMNNIAGITPENELDEMFDDSVVGAVGYTTYWGILPLVTKNPQICPVSENTVKCRLL